MTPSAPSRFCPAAPAATRSVNTPGRRLGGGVRESVRLLDSSSRWNVRSSSGGARHPAGGVRATWAVSGPGPRLVTVIVKCPAPPPPPPPSPPPPPRRPALRASPPLRARAQFAARGDVIPPRSVPQ